MSSRLRTAIAALKGDRDHEVAALEATIERQAHRIADLEMVAESAATEAVRALGDEFERFIRTHAGERITIELRTNQFGHARLRLVTMDQQDVLDGTVRGNAFRPKR